MPFVLAILSVAVFAVFGTVGYGISFFSGSWLAVFPFAGALVLDYMIYKVVKFLIEKEDALDQALRMSQNVLFLLQQPKVQNSKGLEQFLKLLDLPTEEFQKAILRSTISY